MEGGREGGKGGKEKGREEGRKREEENRGMRGRETVG